MSLIFAYYFYLTLNTAWIIILQNPFFIISLQTEMSSCHFISEFAIALFSANFIVFCVLIFTFLGAREHISIAA